MSTNDAVVYKTTNTTASVQIGGPDVGKIRLGGIFVASASNTPTIKVWDNTAGSGAIIANTFTPTGPQWYPLPALCKTGCYITIGGTVDCTVFWL